MATTAPVTAENDFWPPLSAILDLSQAEIISTTKIRCIGIALCNEAGAAVSFFYQGQVAHFYYEFEALEHLGVVGGGVEIHDGLGRLLHGKNSFQYGAQVASAVPPGARLRFHHTIQLDIGAGEYQFSVGIAMTSADMQARYRDGTVLDEDFRRSTQELCRIRNAGTFQVHLDPLARLLHHGLANLPGDCFVSMIAASGTATRSALIAPAEAASATAAPSGTIAAARRWISGHIHQLHAPGGQLAAPAANNAKSTPPTIFHVTHWKAGSQWLYKILMACLPDQIIAPQVGEGQFLYWPLQPGKIYPTLYVTRQQFAAVQLPAEWRRFVIIRDLRDTLISAYFSLKLSHAAELENAAMRTQLQALSFEDGLRLLMDEWLPVSARIQLSWQEAAERLIRYEDLLEHDLEILEPLLLDECKLDIDRARFREAVLANRFEQLTQGRARGNEDVAAHERKGISGDWRNYFSDDIKRMFKHRYGGTLIATGYENDLDW